MKLMQGQATVMERAMALAKKDDVERMKILIYKARDRVMSDFVQYKRYLVLKRASQYYEQTKKNANVCAASEIQTYEEKSNIVKKYANKVLQRMMRVDSDWKVGICIDKDGKLHAWHWYQSSFYTFFDVYPITGFCGCDALEIPDAQTLIKEIIDAIDYSFVDCFQRISFNQDADFSLITNQGYDC